VVLYHLPEPGKHACQEEMGTSRHLYILVSLNVAQRKAAVTANAAANADDPAATAALIAPPVVPAVFPPQVEIGDPQLAQLLVAIPQALAPAAVAPGAVAAFAPEKAVTTRLKAFSSTYGRSGVVVLENL
jgi:hypothetical protein